MKIAQGLSLRTIAVQLGRSPSTVAREVVRNRDVVSGRYGPFSSDQLAQVRARRRSACS